MQIFRVVVLTAAFFFAGATALVIDCQGDECRVAGGDISTTLDDGSGFIDLSPVEVVA